MYVMGIDGGGTKTQCYVGSLDGKILGEGLGGAANYQCCGIESTENAIHQAMDEALKDAGKKIYEMDYIVYGLAGYDEPLDYNVLDPICENLSQKVPHRVMNDTWIGLRSGSAYGVVSVCGTGSAHAGMTPSGETVILRNLDYPLGNRGGGSELVEQALHYAFRSEEGTYHRSRLEEVIPEVFEALDMKQVCSIIRAGKSPKEAVYQIPIEVFRLASEGDFVSGILIKEMGHSLGQYAAGIIRRLGMQGATVPCVLTGSIFATGHPMLVDTYLKEVRKEAEGAFAVIPDKKPVYGAMMLAADYACD